MSPSSSQHSYSRVTVENESSSKETENRLIVLLIKRCPIYYRLSGRPTTTSSSSPRYYNQSYAPENGLNKEQDGIGIIISIQSKSFLFICTRGSARRLKYPASAVFKQHLLVSYKPDGVVIIQISHYPPPDGR